MLKLVSKFLGYIEYHPWWGQPRDDKVTSRLREFLIASGLVEEPENPEIVIDWRFMEHTPKDGVTSVVNVFMYRDGGDAEKPACLFFCDGTGSSGPIRRVHIPTLEYQDELCEAWDWASDFDPEKLNVLTTYINMAIQDESLWFPYETDPELTPIICTESRYYDE